MAGVLLGHAHSASKSICSSCPDSSECRLGTRVASSAERSSIADNDGGLDSGVFMAVVPKGSAEEMGGSCMGERWTEKSVGVWESRWGGGRWVCWNVDGGEFKGAVSMPG
jgi:hypothetical protein